MPNVKLAAAIMALLLAPAACAADGSFDPFWTKFKAAVQKNDKAAIASMTKFPYLLGGNQLNRKQFLAQCPTMFNAKTRKCMLKEKPLKDKDCYEVFCGENIFVFTQDKGTWVFSEVGAND